MPPETTTNPEVSSLPESKEPVSSIEATSETQLAPEANSEAKLKITKMLGTLQDLRKNNPAAYEKLGRKFMDSALKFKAGPPNAEITQTEENDWAPVIITVVLYSFSLMLTAFGTLEAITALVKNNNDLLQGTAASFFSAYNVVKFDGWFRKQIRPDAPAAVDQDDAVLDQADELLTNAIRDVSKIEG